MKLEKFGSECLQLKNCEGGPFLLMDAFCNLSMALKP
jgi:hypothetical protein